jgi:hypothetical protein
MDEERDENEVIDDSGEGKREIHRVECIKSENHRHRPQPDGPLPVP